MSLEWLDEIERRAAEAREHGVMYYVYSPEDVERLIRAVRELAEALGLILAFTLPLIDDQDVAALHMRCQGVLGRWKRGGA